MVDEVYPNIMILFLSCCTYHAKYAMLVYQLMSSQLPVQAGPSCGLGDPLQEQPGPPGHGGGGRPRRHLDQSARRQVGPAQGCGENRPVVVVGDEGAGRLGGRGGGGAVVGGAVVVVVSGGAGGAVVVVVVVVAVCGSW